MLSRPRVAAVVIHYGEAGPAYAAIDALFRSQGVALDWVLVDNNARPDVELRAAVRRVGGRYIHRPENLGFAGGANAGLRFVPRWWMARMVVVMNSDVELFDSCLETLCNVLAETPGIGVVGPGLVRQDAPTVWWNRGSRIEWPQARPVSLGHGERAGKGGAIQDVGFVCGAVMAFPPEVLSLAGELPEDYFLYFEDADYCERLRRAGLRVVVAPAALASHRGGAAFRGRESDATYYQVRNRLVYSKRWSPSEWRGRWQRSLFVCHNALRVVTLLGRGSWLEGRARLRALVHFLAGRVGKKSRGN